VEDVSIDNGLFGIDEAAEYLGVTRRYLRELCLRRKIRFAKPNYRTWAFKKADLEAYLDRITINAKGVYA
jgi:excisionase family DNA binding protein